MSFLIVIGVERDFRFQHQFLRARRFLPEGSRSSKIGALEEPPGGQAKLPGLRGSAVRYEQVEALLQRVAYAKHQQDRLTTELSRQGPRTVSCLTLTVRTLKCVHTVWPKIKKLLKCGDQILPTTIDVLGMQDSKPEASCTVLGTFVVVQIVLWATVVRIRICPTHKS